jgi:outer membrane protein assembly factor BamB
MKFALIFLFLFFSASLAGGQDLSLKPIWSIPSEDLPIFQLSSGFGKIFVPMPNGVLNAVDSENGKTLWKIELGGEFSDKVKVSAISNTIFTINQKRSEGKRLISIRAINQETGIVRWQRTIMVAESDTSPLLFVSENTNVVITSTEIYASDNEKGYVFFRKPISNESIDAKVLDGHFLYEIRNSREIVSVDLMNSGFEKLIYQSKIKLRGKIVVSENSVSFSDILGNVYLYDLVKNRILWQTRLGAEAVDLYSDSDSKNLLVLSKDIYFYQLNKENGNKVRKNRLESSSIGEFAYSVSARSAVVSFDNEVLFIEAKTGSIVNKISMASGLLFPAIVESQVVIAVTSDGITAYK